MILFNSLKEVSEYGNSLIINHSIKELKSFPPEHIIDFTIGGKYWFGKMINEYLNKLEDFSGNASTDLVWIYNEGIWGWLGRCTRQTGFIEISTCLLLLYSYNQVLETLVHEICHFKYNNHSQEFWEFLFASLKKLNLINKEKTFNDVFYNKKDVYKHDIWYESVFDVEYLGGYDKYLILKKNKVFDLKKRDYNRRFFKSEYDSYIRNVKSMYENHP